MEFVASKYDNIRKHYTEYSVDKGMFLETKIDIPFASNLFTRATSFLHPSAKHKTLFSLLLQ